MTEQPLSEKSKAIAKHLIANGSPPIGELLHDNLYEVTRFLSDERELTVTYFDIDNRGVEEPKSNASLRISVVPHNGRGHQIGYKTLEFKLSGVPSKFTILDGSEGGHILTIENNTLPQKEFNSLVQIKYDELLHQIQTKYDELLQDVYAILIDDGLLIRDLEGNKNDRTKN